MCNLVDIVFNPIHIVSNNDNCNNNQLISNIEATGRYYHFCCYNSNILYNYIYIYDHD